IPARSIAWPMMPSSASTSRTRCPLPSPPIAGLHDISPIVARLWVNSSVRAPTRAAAAAASQPACPPPTTTTSYDPIVSLMAPSCTDGRDRCRAFHVKHRFEIDLGWSLPFLTKYLIFDPSLLAGIQQLSPTSYRPFSIGSHRGVGGNFNPAKRRFMGFICVTL